MRPLIILNHTAAKAKHVWPIVRSRLETARIDYDLHQTTSAGDATERSRLALHEGCRTIAVVGGDGTLSEAAAGFFEIAQPHSRAISPDAALAIIPAGTGDDFARGLFGERAAVHHWLEAFVSHCQAPGPQTTRLIDVLDSSCENFTRRFICLNAATMGIGGDTGARVAAQGKFMRNFSGEVRFMIAAIGALAAWRERPVRVTIDEKEVVEGPMNLVAVANGLFAGGGMMLSPDARPDDARLDVITASGLSRLGVVRELPRIHAGGHVANSKVRTMRGKKVRIDTFSSNDGLLIEADGNVRGRTPAEFEVLPGVLRFVVKP